MSDEIANLHKEAEPGDAQPRLDFPPYRSTLLRHPTKDLRHVDPEGAELLAPVFGHSDVDPLEADLTIQASGRADRRAHRGAPAASLDGDGRPVRRQLVEIWQANAAGRYLAQARPAPGAARPELHRGRAAA